MLKQFHLQNKIFADPVIVLGENGETEYRTSGEGWYAVHSQEEINAISASITGGGEVWEENGKIACSGSKPSELHRFDLKSKSWKLLTQKEKNAQAIERLNQHKQDLIAAIAEKTDQLKSQILVGYPQAEIDSFYRQEKEALGWRADKNYPTPMLTALAEKRGVPLELLVEKVIEAADIVAAKMGEIIGTRQAFEDQILQTETLEKLVEIEGEVEKWGL